MRKGICALCDHHEVLVAQPMERTEDGGDRPLSILDLSAQEMLARTSEASTAGTLDTYTCGACGYTQWFARDPQLLSERYVRILRGSKPEGPYR